MYFTEHKLAIEVDGKGPTDRNTDYEIERQKAIEKNLVCKFIRINPDAEKYDIFIEIGKIHKHIIKSTKESTKKIFDRKSFRKTIKFKI